MKINGIICEYNPFHLGHAYLIEQAKRQGDAVVCVMSGNFVQRGDAAIADRYLRAKCAVLGGADLVLELPLPFSASGASYFATAGVELLQMIGADRIVFGSESGNIEYLQELARKSLTAEFADRMAQKKPSAGSAAAYYEALGIAEGIMPPNDILALEYLRALYRSGARIEPLAIKRIGDDFHKEELGSSRFASATAIRAALFEERVDRVSAYMPEKASELFLNAVMGGEAPASFANAERAVLAFFRLTPPERLVEYAGLGGGLAYRLCEAAGRAGSAEELFRLAATKRYTDGAIRRAVLSALLGITYQDLDGGVAYTTVLAANAVGRELLAALRRTEKPILTKGADAELLALKFPDSATRIRRQAELSALADGLYGLCTPKLTEGGAYLRKTPFMM